MKGRKKPTGEFRLLIVDELGSVRERLAEMLQLAGEAKVAIAEAAVADRMAILFSPHVVLLDLDLPGRYALSLAETILGRPRPPRLVFLDRTVRPTNVRMALEVGACGYWTRGYSIEELASALQQVAAGRSSFCPGAHHYLISTPSGLQFDGSAGCAASPSGLTKRESELLGLLAEGLSVRDCARRLGLSRTTVENYKYQMMRKLGVHSTGELIQLAARD